MKRMDKKDFRDQVHKLVGQNVEVITVHGTFRGTLLSVGSNFITMRTRIRGRIVRLLIRLALIVALFRLVGGTGGSFVYTPSRNARDEDDALSNYMIEDDDL
jgi:DNA-binding cell septation regulator SpoVG